MGLALKEPLKILIETTLRKYSEASSLKARDARSVGCGFPSELRTPGDRIFGGRGRRKKMRRTCHMTPIQTVTARKGCVFARLWSGTSGLPCKGKILTRDKRRPLFGVRLDAQGAHRIHPVRHMR
jgi:hypothetical protein